ncbi:hypothetical protein B4U84_23375 [Westiellopsis prolifica IICB1]|nr:hypothetical protein B4U84_23375 [Westiellopsis prolifica IICB1]
MLLAKGLNPLLYGILKKLGCSQFEVPQHKFEVPQHKFELPQHNFEVSKSVGINITILGKVNTPRTLTNDQITNDQ